MMMDGCECVQTNGWVDVGKCMGRWMEGRDGRMYRQMDRRMDGWYTNVYRLMDRRWMVQGGWRGWMVSREMCID